MRKRSSGGEAGTVGVRGGGGVGEACGCVYMDRSLWLPGSSANLLSFYSYQMPGRGTLSFPLQTHLPSGGMQPVGTAEAVGGWRSQGAGGAGVCGGG